MHEGIKIFVYKTYRNLNDDTLETIGYVEGCSLEEAILEIAYNEDMNSIRRIKFFYDSKIVAEYYLKRELRGVKILKERFPNSVVSFSNGIIYLEGTPIFHIRNINPVEYYYS